MIWLLKDFELLSVVLRAVVLALEASALGGLVFLLFVARAAEASPVVMRASRSATAWAAAAFAIAQAAAIGLSVTVLVAGSGLAVRSVISAEFVLAGAASAGCAMLLAALLWPGRLPDRRIWLALGPGMGLLLARVALSHAASRLDNRVLLVSLTVAHHLGMVGWVGAMVFLLLALRQPGLGAAEASALARGYSRIALGAVPLLVVAGAGLGYFYIGCWAGAIGSSYGVMVVAKTYLVLTMLLLGAANQRSLAAGGLGAESVLFRLRRFTEAEIGLGFTAVLVAASLTSQPPGIDLMPQDRVTPHRVVERLRWETPSFTSPPVDSLAPSTSLRAALPDQQFGTGTVNDANDRAWSEYNHHWAGLIVLVAGVFAFLANLVRDDRLARVSSGGPLAASLLERILCGWPLLFLGLAVFILLRADPENWPLGPRPFWASFSRPDVLEHRLYALLITLFGFFEWAVQRGRIRSPRAAWFFPLVCAVGGGALLTHAHALGSMQDETLAELSHTPIALLGATAGWSRWLEVRLPETRAARIAVRVWPMCLALIGLVLLDYRES